MVIYKRAKILRCGSRARLEGDNSKLVFDPVFNGKPVERLECRSDVVSDASAGDDPGQSGSVDILPPPI